MAESAASFLLNQLSIWLHEERELLGGLRNGVQSIRDELEQMRAFLGIADAKEETDPQLKVWVRQVREIAYDADDVLESYMLLFAPRHSHGIGGYLKKVYASMKNLRARQQIASKIKDIRGRSEEVSKAYREKYAMPGSSSTNLASNTWYDGRGDALLLEEADVVGIEKPKKELLEWVSMGDYALKVVAVVGMPGLGKTTLVKKVYDDPSVKGTFVHHVWVSVSESNKDNDLLRDIIKQLHKEVQKEVKQAPTPSLEAMSVGDMREFIYNFLQNKKYIVVLDDIWSANVWEALKCLFPRSNTRGRGCIIITTRFQNIADAACCESGGHIYHLKPLPSQEAEALFHKKAFPGPGNSCPHYLKEISDSILERCEGLPLAIVLIGSILATKKNEIDEWTKFSHSLGTELEVDGLQRMRKSLSLSYHHLPYHLKACFLYLSVFPEDYFLEKATIIRLWIAEGFVVTKHGKTMEETAEKYLEELRNKSLIQVVENSRDGRPRNFRIHDLVRQYVISKATDQNMVAIRSQGETTGANRIRRLALDDSYGAYIEQTCSFKYLRSLLFFGCGDLQKSMLDKVLHGDCRMLNVLDLRGAPIDTIPNEVFKLYHLKCLCLRDTHVAIIPKSIGNLGKLETLDLKRTKVTELPIEILKLERLQYLLVYKYEYSIGYSSFGSTESFKAPYEIGRLQCLQKLCYIEASVNIVREIGKLGELRRLGITRLRREDGNELCSSLAKLSHLCSLNIVSLDEGEVMDLQYPLSTLPFLRTLFLRGCLERVPQWIPNLNALTTLSLGWSRLGEDPLDCLQGLPSLVFLELFCAYEGEGLSFKAGGFQKLKELHLMELRGLRWLRVEKGSMPCLQEMEVSNCKAMMELPAGIEHLTDLSFVEFTDMAEEFVRRVYEAKRGEGKLAHVARVLVGKFVSGEWKVEWL